MNVNIYMSDEGYGHIVRQRAILEELIKIDSSILSTVITHAHHDFAAKNLPATMFVDRFNNIKWHKNKDGSPDLEAMIEYYNDYQIIFDQYVANSAQDAECQFIISDFVYEAFSIGHQNNIPSFGVAHFTWDWFFSKLYPRVINDQLFKHFTRTSNLAQKLFFPPFTPAEILSFYKDKCQEVPFIIRKDIDHKKWPETSRLKILVMDSGAGLMSKNISNALSKVSNADWVFGVLSSINIDGDHLFKVPADHLLVDYVKEADLVIGRPGFNTLSECIAYRIPMLLISESMNPEMEHNISELKKRRLGAFMSIDEFVFNFEETLSRFLKFEFQMISKIMGEHEMETNGAEVIAQEIMDSV